ncbi:MAG: trypsin-like serine protease [Actinomycetes bacterium]
MKFPRVVMRSIIIGALLLVGLVVPGKAQGISYGRPDMGGHPNVGALIGLFPSLTGGDDELFQVCTGTLIAPKVVLTAAHCFPPNSDAKDRFFTFDQSYEANEDGVVVDPDISLYSGHQVVHPSFGASPRRDNQYDMAVFLLDEVPGISPAELPAAGFLNDKALTGQSFTTVGYGITRDTNHKAWQSFMLENSMRMVAEQTLTERTAAWVTFSMNLAAGNGGSCYGDSGGPHLFGDVVVSITVGGDQPCKAVDKTVRIDTPVALEFLGQYVAVP